MDLLPNNFIFIFESTMNDISNTYRFTALSLALLMFLTSMVFVVDVHYCSGHIKSLNFFGKAKACYELASKKCPHHQNNSTQDHATESEKKNCCQNKSFQFEADQDQTTQSVSLILTPQVQQFLTAYVLTFFNTVPVFDTKQSLLAHYTPPLISRDFSVLFEAFLI